MVYIIGPRDKGNFENVISTVSKSEKSWQRGLSPFFLGPCNLYAGYVSENMENGWQYSKVYKHQVDCDDLPTKEWWDWAKEGWANKRAVRYPMGKGAIPLYSYWNGEKLDYIAARKKIYIPLYYNAVKDTDSFKKLKEEYETGKDIYLWDFDGYNHKVKGHVFQDVIDNPKLKMGHAFVLGMMLEDQETLFKNME